MTWHQFRHIHSSLLNDLKVPVKIAQEQLGHASIATTLNIYTQGVLGVRRPRQDAAAIEQSSPRIIRAPDRPKCASVDVRGS